MSTTPADTRIKRMNKQNTASAQTTTHLAHAGTSPWTILIQPTMPKKVQYIKPKSGCLLSVLCFNNLMRINPFCNFLMWLFDFTNVIGQNGSNSDINVAGVAILEKGKHFAVIRVTH